MSNGREPTRRRGPIGIITHLLRNPPQLSAIEWLIIATLVVIILYRMTPWADSMPFRE